MDFLKAVEHSALNVRDTLAPYGRRERVYNTLAHLRQLTRRGYGVGVYVQKMPKIPSCTTGRSNKLRYLVRYRCGNPGGR